MWRAFFLALGIYAVLLGGECLVIDRAVLRNREAPTVNASALSMSSNPQRELSPPEWAPWSLLSTGAITILYSFTIRRGG